MIGVSDWVLVTGMAVAAVLAAGRKAGGTTAAAVVLWGAGCVRILAGAGWRLARGRDLLVWAGVGWLSCLVFALALRQVRDAIDKAALRSRVESARGTWRPRVGACAKRCWGWSRGQGVVQRAGAD